MIHVAIMLRNEKLCTFRQLLYEALRFSQWGKERKKIGENTWYKPVKNSSRYKLGPGNKANAVGLTAPNILLYSPLDQTSD
jgi:hypothetical protein